MADRANLLHTQGEDQRPLSVLIGQVLGDVSRIVQAELRLARTELGEQARKAGKAGGLFGAAAVTGLLAAGCFVAACIAALALLMAVWLAAVVVGIALGIAAAGAYAAGRKRLQDVDVVPQQTVRTVREDIEWAKQRNR